MNILVICLSAPIEDELESSPHLFDLGDVSDEGLVVHKLQEFPQLIQITDVVLTDPLMFRVQDSINTTVITS